jgi:hypothetical protein
LLKGMGRFILGMRERLAKLATKLARGILGRGRGQFIWRPNCLVPFTGFDLVQSSSNHYM